MSILTIAQNISAEAGFQQPTYLIGNPDEIAIQLLSLIKRETRLLSDEFFWQKLITDYTFNYVSGQASYALPADYNYILPKTIWNSSARQPLICPISPQDWAIQKYYLVTSAYYKQVYMYNNLMEITPTPTSTDTINYQYISNNIYASALGVPQPNLVADTDTTVVREFIVELGVKLRFLIAKGLISPNDLENSFEKKDYDAQIKRQMMIDGIGQKILSMNSGGGPFWMAAETQDSNWPQV